jgi:hypothetical protein
MKPKYKRVCPYCGETCEGYVGNSLICKCGAKYYYTTQTWLDRKKPKEKNTPDLVEVVRCKDCKCYRAETVLNGTANYGTCCRVSYVRTDLSERFEDDYCSHGERR